MSDNDRPAGPPDGFLPRAVAAAAVALAAALVAWAFARAADVFFLFFAAVLLGVFLRGVAGALGRAAGLGPRWSLGLVVAVLAAAVAGVGYVLGDVVAQQADRVAAELPRAADRAREYLGGSEWGRLALEHLPSAGEVATGGSGDAVRAAARLFTTTFGAAVNVLVVAFMGLYFAADPRRYTEGLLRLVPPARRARGREVLAAVGDGLWWWLLGRAVAMLGVGAAVGVGLWAIGVREYLALAVLAAALDVVPFFGPLVAAVPAVLLGLLAGPATAGWVLALYLAVQVVESEVALPLIQQYTVRLPPAATVGVIVLAGAVFGVAAVLVATPLAVAAMIAVRMLYVEDVLEGGGPAGPPGTA